MKIPWAVHGSEVYIRSRHKEIGAGIQSGNEGLIGEIDPVHEVLGYLIV